MMFDIPFSGSRLGRRMNVVPSRVAASKATKPRVEILEGRTLLASLILVDPPSTSGEMWTASLGPVNQSGFVTGTTAGETPIMVQDPPNTYNQFNYDIHGSFGLAGIANSGFQYLNGGGDLAYRNDAETGGTPEPFSMAIASSTQANTSYATYKILPDPGEAIGQAVVITMDGDMASNSYTYSNSPVADNYTMLYQFQYKSGNGASGSQAIQESGSVASNYIEKSMSFIARIGDTFQFSDSLSASGTIDPAVYEIDQGAEVTLSVNPVPDIALGSAATGGIRNLILSYSISGSDLSQPFDVAVYGSPTPTFDINTAVPTGDQATIPPTDSAGNSSTTQGQHTVNVSLPLSISVNANSADPYLFVVADPPSPGDPQGKIIESNENNNDAPLTLGSVSPSALNWHANEQQGGGVDVSYVVNGGPLLAPTRIGLYWAKGPHLSDRLGSVVATIPIAAGALPPGVSSPSYHIPAASLGVPPAGTTYLLAIADDQQPLTSADEASKVKTLAASPQDILRGSITIVYKNKAIAAEFQPAAGALTLKQAAAICGVDDFNWLQTTTVHAARWIRQQIWKNVNPSYIPGIDPKTLKGYLKDPLTGKLIAVSAENIPLNQPSIDPIVQTSHYQDRYAVIGRDKNGKIGVALDTALPASALDAKPTYYTASELANPQITSTFHTFFGDMPGQNGKYFGDPGDYVAFSTALVGENGGAIKKLPLAGFTWKSNGVLNGGGGVYAVQPYSGGSVKSIKQGT